jgi:hypothetical protein
MIDYYSKRANEYERIEILTSDYFWCASYRTALG